MKIDRGLVYIGKGRKNFTYGRYYSLLDPPKYIICYCIMDNCGENKSYSYEDIWYKKNFKVMKKKEYILWSRSVKLEKLNLIYEK